MLVPEITRDAGARWRGDLTSVPEGLVFLRCLTKVGPQLTCLSLAPAAAFRFALLTNAGNTSRPGTRK